MNHVIPCAVLMLAMCFTLGCGSGGGATSVVPPAADAATMDAANAAYEAEQEALTTDN